MHACIKSKLASFYFGDLYPILQVAKLEISPKFPAIHYFSMQLAVDVRIPELFGGVEGEAIFIGSYNMIITSSKFLYCWI